MLFLCFLLLLGFSCVGAVKRVLRFWPAWNMTDADSLSSSLFPSPLPFSSFSHLTFLPSQSEAIEEEPEADPEAAAVGAVEVDLPVEEVLEAGVGSRRGVRLAVDGVLLGVEEGSEEDEVEDEVDGEATKKMEDLLLSQIHTHSSLLPCFAVSVF